MVCLSSMTGETRRNFILYESISTGECVSNSVSNERISTSRQLRQFHLYYFQRFFNVIAMALVTRTLKKEFRIFFNLSVSNRCLYQNWASNKVDTLRGRRGESARFLFFFDIYGLRPNIKPIGLKPQQQ